MVRNQSLMEMWWLFTTLMRYPREIFNVTWASPVGWFFTFIVPVLLVVNVPANVMVRALDWRFVAFMMLSAAVLLLLSRGFFRHALRSYRSASS
jgi:ABC-2 type transport system permease protein